MKGFSLGSLFVSHLNRSIAPEGSLGILIKHDTNGFNGKSSGFIVFDNNQYAEYFDDQVPEEVIPIGLNFSAFESVSFESARDIAEHIKGGSFIEAFNHLKTKSNVTEAMEKALQQVKEQ